MKSASFETLSLNLLKTFCVFAQVGKVEDAAQKLGITQASVSLQLKKLEEEAGQTLFKTIGRKKLLSSFARDLFHSIAPPLLELEHRLKEVSKTQVPLSQRTLRIGCRHELIKRLTPLVQFPGEVFISGMTSFEALSAIRNDEIDIAVVPNPKITGKWYSRKLFSDQPQFIANPKIFKGKDWERLTPQILKHPAIAYKKSKPFLNEVVESLGENSSDIKVKLYCEDWDSIVQEVKTSPTWSVLPRYYEGLLEGLTVIEVPKKVLPLIPIYSVYSKEWRNIPIFNINE
jgi:DNA-binding transcriptional LysR family regulator